MTHPKSRDELRVRVLRDWAPRLLIPNLMFVACKEVIPQNDQHRHYNGYIYMYSFHLPNTLTMDACATGKSHRGEVAFSLQKGDEYLLSTYYMLDPGLQVLLILTMQPKPYHQVGISVF